MESQIDFVIPLGSQELTFSPTDFETVVEDFIKKDEFLSSVQCDEDTTPSPAETIQICDYQEAYPTSVDTTRHAAQFPQVVTSPEDSMLYPPVAPEQTVYPLGNPDYVEEGPYPPRPGPPDQTPFPGPYNFSVELSTTPSNNKCLYSKRLNKIYVDMGSDVPFQFRWADTGRARVYVRACAVFVDKEHAQKRVHCCRQHCPENLPHHIARNVFHSSRALGTCGVHYQGRAEPDYWHSVLVAFPGAAARAHAYRFTCKSSCSSGVNRRALGLVFTLEDEGGNVLGRRVINARVCSCPPRDRRKDEGEDPARGKRRLAPGAPGAAGAAGPPKGKKIKVEPVADEDLSVVTLPELRIVGANTAIAGLEMMVHMTRQAAALRPHEPRLAAAAAASLAALSAAILRLRGH